MDKNKKRDEVHGHISPGLVIGYRVSKYVHSITLVPKMRRLVCIAENNSCSVDAVQALLGCTFGKGNLAFRDNGKQVFTIYFPRRWESLRICFKGDLTDPMDTLGGNTPKESFRIKEEGV